MRAAAYVVGDGADLTSLVQEVGFEVVLPYGGVESAEAQALETPVCFFLFAPVPDAVQLRRVAEAVRFCPSRRIRFSPMIYFSDNVSADTIGTCINFGFDDVVTWPISAASLWPRLERQVQRNMVYYETPGYFGPDRRDRVTAPRQAAESRLGGQFRRLEIVRHLQSGVEVLRDEFYSQLPV